MNHLERTYEAVLNGAQTSAECADATGISKEACSSWLSILRKRGLIRATGRALGSGPRRQGTAFTLYEAVCPRCQPANLCVACIAAPHLKAARNAPSGRILDADTAAHLFR